MNSILKISFRQTENLLRLTKTIVHAFRLQRILENDTIDTKDHHPCDFSYDLCNELRLLQKQLHSTCFSLQQALYRVQALRQIRGDLPILIDENIIIQYEQNLSPELENIHRIISSVINKDPSLNTLQALFKQIQENFQIFLDYIYGMPVYKSTIYLGNLVSDTLERFYLILRALTRLAMNMEVKSS